MKPTAPPRNKFSVFATTPWISSRCPASLVRFSSARSRLPPYCCSTLAVAYDVFFPRKPPSGFRSMSHRFPAGSILFLVREKTMSRFESITIREVEFSDLEIFYEHQLDPEAIRMAAFVCEDPKDKVALDAHS